MNELHYTDDNGPAAADCYFTDGAGDLGALHDSLVIALHEGVLTDDACKHLYEAALAARRAAGGLKTLRELTSWSKEQVDNAHQEANWARLVVAHGPDGTPLYAQQDVAAELARMGRG